MNESTAIKLIAAQRIPRREAVLRWILLSSLSGCDSKSPVTRLGTNNGGEILNNLADLSQHDFKYQIQELSDRDRQSLADNALLRLSELDGLASDEAAGVLLELLRGIKAAGTSFSAAPLIQLLSARCRLYQGRSKPEIVRLRSFLLLSAAFVGCGDRIAGLVLENLTNGATAYSLACAARSARLLPINSKIPIAMEPHVAGIHADSIMSLDRYRQDFPVSEQTSAHLEILRTIGYYGPAAKQLRAALQSCIERLQRIQIQTPLPVLAEAIASFKKIG